MRSIAVISDIHGNRLAFEAVLEDISRRGVEATYCLGDLVGYGPDPNGVIDLIRERGIPTILGNYDDGIGHEAGDCGCYYPTAEDRAIGDASYAFTVAEVTVERKAFMRGLLGEQRIVVGDAAVHLVHGSPRKINEYLMRDRDERTFLRLAGTEDADALVFGHTHEQWSREYGGVLFVAVGSVGRPKDGDPRAMYTVLRAAEPDGRAAGDSARLVEVERVRVSYDVEEAARAIVAAGLPPALADRLRRGK